ncbi:MAG: TolC family protein [Planctomycetes bacterium]|nr:TolC family protein [Planctomycetota bacterium]
MNNLFHLSARASALALLLVAGCQTQPLEQPGSVGPDIASRAGVTPAWTKPDAVAIGADALRSAATVALPDPLNEVEAVAIALDASPAIARMISETNALRAEAIDISAPQNPVLNFTSGVPLDSMSAVPIFAMLMVQIDELWKQPIRSESARDSYQSALLSLGASAVSLAAETRSAWHETALRDEERGLARHDLEITQRLLVMARDRFAAGEADGNTVAKAQAEYLDAHHRLARATEMHTAAQLSLMALLGRVEASTGWRTGVADPSSAHALFAEVTDEQSLLSQLASTRLDVRAAHARMHAAASKLELARRSRLNTIDLGGGFERDMEGDQAAMFSANIEIPIFNDGSARIAKAEAELATASIEAERVRQAAIIELRSALTRAFATEDRRNASAESLLAPSTETFKRAQAALAAGESSQRELIDAEHSLNHAKLEMTDLERERRAARLVLAKAAGFLPAEVMP